MKIINSIGYLIIIILLVSLGTQVYFTITTEQYQVDQPRGVIVTVSEFNSVELESNKEL